MSLTEISQAVTRQPVDGNNEPSNGMPRSHGRGILHDSKSRRESPEKVIQSIPRKRYFAIKSGFDRALGFCLFVVCSPVILILAMIVRFTSRGPAIYRQTRVGKNQDSFELLKLRSMVQNAETPGKPVWCVTNDVRITKVGRVLRKLHLDELPQLWNVAKGEMSLVGPRPERPEICENLAEEIHCYHDRHQVKPGITGLSQINLPPDQTIEDVQKKQILDVLYIQEANIWLDLRMVLATALRMFGIKGETVIRLLRLCRRDYLHQVRAAEESSLCKGDESCQTRESVESLELPRFPR